MEEFRTLIDSIPQSMYRNYLEKVIQEYEENR